MKLFFELLKIRIRSVFAGNGTGLRGRKNTGFKVFIGIMIGYSVLCFIGIFAFYFSRLAHSFVEEECGWAFFSMMAVIIMSIGFITTVFAAQSQIFEARDNELLMSMPIPVRYIAMSRIATLLIIETLESLVIGVEGALIYGLFAEIPPLGYLFLIIVLFGLNLLTASVSTLIGWALAAITAKFHRKSLVKTVSTLILAAAFFAAISAGEIYLNKMLDSDVAMEDAMNNLLYPFYCFGKAVGEGEITGFLIFMAISLLVFFIMIYTMSPFFLRITTTKKGTAAGRYNPENNKMRSVKKALYLKEIKRFFTNASYMLNTGLGLIVMLAASVLVIIEKKPVIAMVNEYPYVKDNVGVFILFIELFLCMLNVVSSPSISLEGESLWICKSMPLKAGDILMSKVWSHISICMPFVLIFGIAVNIAVPLDLMSRLAIFAVPAASTIFTAHLGVVNNLMLPKFNWTDESVAVKQSLAVVATMGIGFGMLVLGFIGYALVYWIPGCGMIFIAVFFLTYVIASVIMHRYMYGKGSARFLEL